MSQYTNFFLRGNDHFYSLGDFGRSSAIAQIVNDSLGTKYDVAYAVTQEMLDGWRYETQNKIAAFEKRKAELAERIEFIRTCADGSLDEKYQFFVDYISEINDIDDEIEYFKQALNYFQFLTWLEDPVYVGIECGAQPGEIRDDV